VNRILVNLIRWLVILAIPIFLVLTTARFLMNDWYPRSAYAKPDFPRDPYGFTQEQRLELALVAIAYLNRPEPAEQAITMLEEQRLPGTDLPLYTDFEISHMLDVKRFTDLLWRVQLVAGLIILGGSALLVARPSTRVVAFNALFGGGLLTTLLLAALAVFVLLAWSTFFVQFHELFFAPGSWTFDYSDSLIRLFPDKFWFDAGTIIVVATLVEGILVAAAGYILAGRAGRSNLQYSASKI
jgi:integral membrane protein (TIGR01906 family)